MKNNLSSKTSFTNSSFWKKYQFYFLLLAAVIIRQIPIISLPFNWLESYFHEISHGIAALFTGGNIIRIQLFANGAGLCTTQGGFNFLITFLGYAGASFWGWGIYRLASAHQRVAQVFSGVILLLLLCSIIFWARDLLTIIILASLITIFASTIKLRQLHYLQVTMQFIGLSILLNSLFSPFYLLDGRHIGDGATLASATFIPEIIWVAIWCFIAVVAVYSLAKQKIEK
jgi:hypothetical protein